MSLPAHLKSRHLPLGDQRTGRFYGQDILSVSQFTRDDLEYIFGVADAMRNMVAHIGTFDLLKGKILANLFYEPSTRTSSSFTAAMERLGGSVIPISEVRYSSVSKGESLPDTVRTLEWSNPPAGTTITVPKDCKPYQVPCGFACHMTDSQIAQIKIDKKANQTTCSPGGDAGTSVGTLTSRSSRNHW